MSERGVALADADLLRKAYANPRGFETGQINGKKTLAIAGTRDLKDWLTDAAYVVGMERYIPGNRFDDADRVYRDVRPDRVIGHSLGGAVASRFPNSRGYNPWVPLLGPNSTSLPDEIYRSPFDIPSAPSAFSVHTTTDKHNWYVDPLNAHVLPWE